MKPVADEMFPEIDHIEEVSLGGFQLEIASLTPHFAVVYFRNFLLVERSY